MIPIPMISNVSGPTPVPPAQRPFKITIDTTKYSGDGDNKRFSVYVLNGYSFNVNVKWGDGTNNNYSGGPSSFISFTKIYSTAGIYQIEITGILETISFNPNGTSFFTNSLRVISLDQWGDILWKDFSNSFRSCSNLVANYIDSPVLSYVTSLNQMFVQCDKFNGVVDNWNVSSITNMSGLFSGCDIFNKPMNSWDTSSVTSMDSMLAECSVFNQPLSNWNVGSVTNMSFMFSQCTAFNQNLNTWNTTSLTNISATFNFCTSFNQPINNWDVSNVTSATSFMTGKSAGNYNATYLDDIYNSWSLLTLQPSITISFGAIKYTSAGSAGKSILTGSPNNWTITDGGI